MIHNSRISRRLVVLGVLVCLLPAMVYAVDVDDAKRAIRTKHYDRAVVMLKTLSNRDNGEAQYLLAVMYRNGHGVDRDLKKAFYWMRKVAAAGDGKACYQLAVMYEKGLGVGQDSGLAENWYRKAAAKGIAQAARRLKNSKGNVTSRQELNQQLIIAVQRHKIRDTNRLLRQGADANATDANGHSALTIAAQKGSANTLAALLKAGADPKFRLPDKDTPLHIAARNGNVDLVGQLIRARPDINSQNQLRQTPLHEAVKRGHVDVVNQLIKAGAALELRDNTGKTAMAWAGAKNHRAIVAALRQAGAKTIRQPTRQPIAAGSELLKDWTPLMLAAWRGQAGQVRELLKQGRAAGLVKSDRNGYTALTRAVWKGHSEVVALLLTAGADANGRIQDGTSPLMISVRENHLPAAKKLLLAGAKPNYIAPFGESAMTLAAALGRQRFVQLLVDHGGRLHASEGKRLLNIAAEHGHRGVVSLLLKLGEKPNKQDRYGRASIWYAADKGHTEVVKLLLKHKGVLLKDNEGYSPLMRAVMGGHVGVVKKLLAVGAHINSRSPRQSHSPLMLAAANGQLAVLELLIKYKANINLQNKQGDTALILAARKGHRDCVKTLLEAKADINLWNKNKFKALDVATRAGQDKIVDMLKSHQSKNSSGIWPF